MASIEESRPSGGEVLLACDASHDVVVVEEIHRADTAPWGGLLPAPFIGWFGVPVEISLRWSLSTQTATVDIGT